MPPIARFAPSWNRRTAAAILVLAAIALPLALWQAAQVQLENNVDSWLPSKDRQARVLAWYHKYFPEGEQILLTWDGGTLGDPRFEKLAGRLRNELPQHVDSVITPNDLIARMTEFGVDHKEAVDRLRGVLIGPQPADSIGRGSKSESHSAAPAAMAVALTERRSADRSDALSAIRQMAAAVGIPGESLHLAGGPIAGSELNAAVQRAVWDSTAAATAVHRRSLMLLAVGVSVVLAFVMLRSVRLAVGVLVVSGLSTLLAITVVPLTNGSMSMLLVVMPPLLFVLTVSAAIHVANYWTHAAQENQRTATSTAFRLAVGPCGLASLTTAIGLISLATSPLAPVRQLGIYSAIGCLISLSVVLFVLPALLHCWPGTPRRVAAPRHTRWPALGRLLCRRHLHVAVASAVLFVLGLYGLQWFRAENKVIRYFAESSRVMQDYEALESRLAGVVPVETIVRFSDEARQQLTFLERLELVRRIENEMREHPSISGALSLADFQPVTAIPAENAGFFEKAGYFKKSHEMERQARQAGSEASVLYAVAQADADLYEAGDRRLSSRGDELWRITAQTSLLDDMDYGALTDDLDWIARSVLKHHPGAGHVVTGTIPVLLKTQQAVLKSLIQSFGLAFGMIAVVMAVLLRNPLAGLLSMLPNLLPVVVVFGLLSWSGMAVDIGTMITASVALGIAVDGTLHLLTWFRKGLADGLSRTEAISQALSHCGPALWQTSAAVGFGLLSLLPSELVLISRFGWLMAAVIGAAMVANLLLLPALLAGPLGWIIERSMRPASNAAGEIADELALDVLGLEAPSSNLSLGTVSGGPGVRID